MRKLIFSVLLLLTCLFASHVYAKLPMSSMIRAQSEPVLLHMETITPKNRAIDFDEVIFSGGYETNGNCDYSQTAYASEETPEDLKNATTTSDDFTSDDIKAMFGGENVCMKFDVIYQGNTFSTGDIHFIWNNNKEAYVEAIPSHVTLNIR